MQNIDVYLKDPSKRKLANEGVANVNDFTSDGALNILRYELETFVCDGQYEKGVQHILATYLSNIKEAQQPSVWVSGFFGSGKSHLVKMLRALWQDVKFSDGATARGVAVLTQEIRDQFVELSNAAKLHGGLFAASGTLGSGSSSSVRLALLSIIFKCAGYRENYSVAMFVHWLKEQGSYDRVKARVATLGHDWEEELDNFYVASGLFDALAHEMPDKFPDAQAVSTTLNNQFRPVTDVTNSELIQAINKVLTKDGKFPLTLIVLDEIQQYIGESSQRSIDVQEMVETCSKSFSGKLLFIGTGQTGVTGTSNLAKLQGRFTVRVELSDTDVDSVVRKVVLAKQPTAVDAINSVFQNNSGEVTRHLAQSAIGTKQEDPKVYADDYPILPVRRRFWEAALRVLDQTGTDSQLRNQLSMVHKAIQTNLSEPVGNVIAADYLYFDAMDKMLQARILPRTIYDQTKQWRNGSSDELLMARACGLVFLINKVAQQNSEIGIKADVDTLADLLIEDLSAGSAKLRLNLQTLMDACPLLMKVDDQYRIQTEESTAWTNEFHSVKSALASSSHVIEEQRDQRLKASITKALGLTSIPHGKSKVARQVNLTFGPNLDKEAQGKLTVWVRDGWSIERDSVLADIRQLGNDSPVILLYVPKTESDGLRTKVIEYVAAKTTLDKRGHPNNPEGIEARLSMTTIQDEANKRIEELINEAISKAYVYLAGGQEFTGNSIAESVKEAAKAALVRLYKHFDVADSDQWSKVVDKAQKGDANALQSVGYDGEQQDHPVCKKILESIAGGKTGTAVRTIFESSPYGWSQDAIDGALYLLTLTGALKAVAEDGTVVTYNSFERRAIGKCQFRLESTTISAQERIAIRRLFLLLHVRASSNSESASVNDFLDALRELQNSAGGNAPCPEVPNPSLLVELRRMAGNEQLKSIYENREELTDWISDWQKLKKQIAEILPVWQLGETLAAYASSLPDASVLITQINAIRESRQLLASQHSLQQLVESLTQMLRTELNALGATYTTEHAAFLDSLVHEANWLSLETEQRHQLLVASTLNDSAMPKIEVETAEDIVKTLSVWPLQTLSTTIAALPGRFADVSNAAAKLLEPQTQLMRLPSATIKTELELDAWLQQTRVSIMEKLSKGPVKI